MMKLRQYHFSWLVAMAAGVAMTAMTACSSENDLTETPNVEQPAQPTAKGVTVTVTALSSCDHYPFVLSEGQLCPIGGNLFWLWLWH